jgi:hypothetical protein
MKVTLHLFVLVLALVLFVLAGLGVPEHARFRYIGFGLFLWALSTVSFGS